MEDPRDPWHRAADGRARRHDREHRVAVGTKGAALLQRQPPVDRHRVRARVREPAADRRAHQRLLRPQVDVHRGTGRIRGRLCDRRRRTELRRAGRGAHIPGSVRRAAGTGGAFAADHHVHRGRRAQQGVRCLQRDRRQRRLRGPAARRRAHAVPELALQHVRQPGVRDDCDRGRADPAAKPGPGRPAQTRLARDIHGDRRLVRAGVRLLARRDHELGQPADPRACSRAASCSWPLFACDRVAGRAPAASAAGRHRPQPRRLVPVDRDLRRGDVRRVPVPHLLPAADPRLLAGHHRAGVPADDRGGHGLRGDRERRGCAPGSARGPRRHRNAARCRRHVLPDPAGHDLELCHRHPAGARDHGCRHRPGDVAAR